MHAPARGTHDKPLTHCSGTTRQDCQAGGDLTNKARSAGKIAIASFVIGGAAVASGAALVLWPSGLKADATAARLTFAPGLMGLRVEGAW